MMIRKILYLLLMILFTGCTASKVNNATSIPQAKQIESIENRLKDPKISKYYFTQKQQIIERIKLLHEYEKNKEYKKANMLRETLLSDTELLLLKADIEDMNVKKRQYKKDLEVYGNNTVLDELDEILKEESDDNTTIGVE